MENSNDDNKRDANNNADFVYIAINTGYLEHSR